eukprot:762521-Hanusia_phi.AAC.15
MEQGSGREDDAKEHVLGGSEKRRERAGTGGGQRRRKRAWKWWSEEGESVRDRRGSEVKEERRVGDEVEASRAQREERRLMFALLRMFGYVLSRRRSGAAGGARINAAQNEVAWMNTHTNEDLYEHERMVRAALQTPKVCDVYAISQLKTDINWKSNKQTLPDLAFTPDNRSPALPASIAFMLLACPVTFSLIVAAFRTG